MSRVAKKNYGVSEKKLRAERVNITTNVACSVVTNMILISCSCSLIAAIKGADSCNMCWDEYGIYDLKKRERRDRKKWYHRNKSKWNKAEMRNENIKG